MAKKKFYITTPIYYSNRPPHVGSAYTTITADTLARYHRAKGKDVFFLTGVDEHGNKVAQTAKEARKSPQKFCDEISAKFRDLKRILNLSNDDFIRTTDQKRHWPAVRKVWLKLKEKGDIYKKKYQGLYCVGCESFLAEKDLINEKCVYHQKEPEMVEEENYFFKLSKYQRQIQRAIEKNKIKIIPQSRKNEMLSFIKQGLEDISFSRPRKDLKWGIPVPNDDSQTIYVWADALTNYISAIGYFKETKNFKKYWPVDVHCIGKDIQKFHCAIWPGMLLSLKLPLPKTIFVHGFITVSGQKMSKSLGNVIDPFELVKKYGTDAVRYFLLREIPSTEDGDFTYQKFEGRYNSDLAKGLGNLVARVIALAKNSKFDHNPFSTGWVDQPFNKGCGEIRNPKQIRNPKFKTKINQTWRNYHKALEDFKFNEALIPIWGLISFCDRYIEKEKPWEKSKKQKQVISNLLLAVSEIAKLLEPFLPETSEKILRQIKIQKSKPLFPRIF